VLLNAEQLNESYYIEKYHKSIFKNGDLLKLKNQLFF